MEKTQKTWSKKSRFGSLEVCLKRGGRCQVWGTLAQVGLTQRLPTAGRASLHHLTQSRARTRWTSCLRLPHTSIALVGGTSHQFQRQVQLIFFLAHDGQCYQ